MAPPFQRRTPGRTTTRVLALVLAGLLLAIGAVGTVVWQRLGTGRTTVHGVIGSEKEPYFEHPDVVARFAELGYEVVVETAGSRAIATSADLSGVDFAFPSSTPAAEEIARRWDVDRRYEPFYSPMAVLSRASVAETLAAEGVAERAADGTWTFDMAGYLELTEERTRWRDLGGQESNRNEVLVRTTDPRSSNSAAMYLVVTGYLLNGEEVVQEGDADGDMMDEVARLFLAQGDPPQTSQQPFDQFVALGAGHTPLLWGYEAQFVAAKLNMASFPEDIVLMYPGPTTISTHTVLPLTEAGDEIGRLLSEDPELQRLAARHGFRTNDPDEFAQVVAENDLPVRAQIADVVNAPAHEVLNGMIAEVERRYSDSGAGPPAADEGELPDMPELDEEAA
ncbi:hypothetical protein [Marinactinospora rubrisoli]|uniref:Extracellular solute-binding protein n=1 Tax=Marinactinospora rubrisoli TaxID=2715399 RepID=A0ABW2KPH4_9ACTN